jgi:hypothetical protein
MLKRILFSVVLLVVLLNLGAQDQFKPSTYFGITAGFNISRVSFTPTIKQKLLTSSSVGLVLRHMSEPHIGLQLELNYGGKGWIENLDSIGTYKRNLQVISIPMLAVFIAGSKTVRFPFTLGPYVSYLKDEKESIAVADTQYYRTYYLKSLPSNWEFGFTIGLGIELYTKIGVFGIKASYSHSLTNLFPLNASQFYFNASRSQVLFAGLTYYIKL